MVTLGMGRLRFLACLITVESSCLHSIPSGYTGLAVNVAVMTAYDVPVMKIFKDVSVGKSTTVI